MVELLVDLQVDQHYEGAGVVVLAGDEQQGEYLAKVEVSVVDEATDELLSTLTGEVTGELT